MKPIRIMLVAMLLTPAWGCAGEGDQLHSLADVPVKERNPTPKAKVWPVEVGQADVSLWHDDKIAAFSITIDDNTKPDHAWWTEQGKKYGFRFTWFINTRNLVDAKNSEFAGTWADFQALLDNGHDVQSHSVTHRNKELAIPIDDDYGLAINHINENLKGVRCLTMAYPGGALPNDPAVAAKYYAGVRGTKSLVNPPSPDYLDILSIGSASHAFVEAGQTGSWASILGVIEPDEKSPNKYRGWYCMHFHGVQWNEQARNTIAPPLVTLLDYIKERERLVWVAPFREVVLYGQERDTARLTVTRVDDKEIRFTLTDRMFDEWYDFPLTIKIRIRNDWQAVRAVQGDKTLTASVVDHEGHKYALIHAVPDRGEVAVVPSLAK